MRVRRDRDRYTQRDSNLNKSKPRRRWRTAAKMREKGETTEIIAAHAGEVHNVLNFET